MTSIKQPTFAAGEISPSASARTDIDRYFTALKTCRNFNVIPSGGVRNRAGTRLVCEVKDSSKLCRLIPFQFNDQQTYMLMFGDLNMRVIKDGGQVLYSSGGSAGQPFELALPYLQSDLALINFTQSADVMTLAQPEYRPRELSRLGHDNWTSAELNLAPRIAAPASVTATPVAGDGVTQSWRYQVTAVLDDGDSLDESLPATSNSITVNNSTLSGELTWPAVAGATYYIVYKDNAGAGIYGFIGRASGTTFTDRNITAVKGDTPPNGNDPFQGAGNYPGAVGYYQQRLVFAGSNLNPQTVWMSKTGLFKNFGFSVPNKDDDAITFTIASREVNRVRHLVGLRKLLGLTSGGEWTFSGADTGLTAKTIQAAQEGYDGSSIVPPVVVGNSALYVQARGSRVSSFGYSLDADGFAADDLTLFSSHLFRGRTLTSVAYQKVPDSIVWYTRDDGILLGLTYLPEQKLVGWTWHDTDGFVEGVASVPEGQEDAVYMVVRRTINGVQRRFVERMASRQVTAIEDAFFVDCGLSYDGRGSSQVTLSGGTDWLYPNLLTLTSTADEFEHEVSQNRLILVNIDGGSIRMFLPTQSLPGSDLDQTLVLVGSDGERLRVVVTEYVDARTIIVRPESIVPESLRAKPAAVWGRAKMSFSGVGHLEGKTVSILADGNVEPQAVVAQGSVSLASPAMVVHIGLPYTSDLETLDIEMKASAETLLDKSLAVIGVTILTEDSRGIFAGPKLQEKSLYEYKPNRFNYENPLELITGRAEILIPNAWDTNGRVCIRQSDPLPLTVLAIIPKVTIGGS